MRAPYYKVMKMNDDKTPLLWGYELAEITPTEFLYYLPIADPGEGGGAWANGTFTVERGFDCDTVTFHGIDLAGKHWLIGRVVIMHEPTNPTEAVKAFGPVA